MAKRVETVNVMMTAIDYASHSAVNAKVTVTDVVTLEVIDRKQEAMVAVTAHDGMTFVAMFYPVMGWTY